MGWKKKTPDASRYERAEKRKRRRIENEVAPEINIEETEEEIEVENSGVVGCTNEKCQAQKCDCAIKSAEEIVSLKEEIRLLKEKICSLETEVAGLKKKLDDTSLNAECLEKNKSKLKFYTGMYVKCFHKSYTIFGKGSYSVNVDLSCEYGTTLIYLFFYTITILHDVIILSEVNLESQ